MKPSDYVVRQKFYKKNGLNINDDRYFFMSNKTISNIGHYKPSSVG